MNFHIKHSISAIKLIIINLIIIVFISSCGLYKKSDARKVPSNAMERAQKNVKEGRGVSIGNVLKRGTNFEFSTSNPMWRASLEVLDFLPLSNVDYSGGVIITDWYNDSSNLKESIKITVRFLSNEIQSNSIKIVVHRKNCMTDSNCQVLKIDSKIEEALTKSILSKAIALERSGKNKKK